MGRLLAAHRRDSAKKMEKKQMKISLIIAHPDKDSFSIGI